MPTAAKRKRKVKLTGKIAGGKLITPAGLRYTFTGKDLQWATHNDGKVVTVDLVLTPLGRGTSVKRLPPSHR